MASSRDRAWKGVYSFLSEFLKKHGSKLFVLSFAVFVACLVMTLKVEDALQSLSWFFGGLLQFGAVTYFLNWFEVKETTE